MRKYETIFIVNPDLSEDDRKDLIEKVKGIIDSHQGETLKVDEWGTRKLAYEVKKMSKGHYVLLHYVGGSPVIKELERNLRLMDGVLKYQTVRLDAKDEKAAQMLAQERLSEKEHKPETPAEDHREKVAAKEEASQEVAQEEPHQETENPEQPEASKEEESRS
jgi:small subunit ribosomal protein S6